MARSEVLNDEGGEESVASAPVGPPQGGYFVKRFLSDRKHAFTVFVRMWTSTTVALQVEASETVGSVKEKIRGRDRERRTPGGDRQILVFDGVELEDHQTLEYYGIENGASLDQRVKRYVRRRRAADGSVVAL